MNGKSSRATGVLVLALASPFLTRAQLGMDLFKKPSITKAFHPLVGKGAEYETTTKGNGEAKGHTMEMGIVGKETVDGKDGYWLEFVSSDDKGQRMVGKSLLTAEDFQFHKMIIQPPGQEAVELPTNMARSRQPLGEGMNDWHSVGSETVTVPAGTFSCEHWKNDKNGSEAWTSDQVAPFGMVKEVGKTSTTVLVKVVDNFPERISGPVKQFDMQQMMRQQMQQRQPAPQPQP